MSGFGTRPLALVLVTLLAHGAAAQSAGPDVTVSSLTDVGAYGQSLGITAFAVGTVACNIGNVPVQWIQSNNQHPVIAQNMYRYLDGRFQQIGQSWLKHGFASTNSPGCGTCVQPPGGGSELGVGCTDAYGSGLNGNQSYLGPRFEVNPATGAYPWPHSGPGGDATIMGRLQVKNGDLDPVANAGARYFVEAHYVTADDALAGNKNNNSTWQEIMPPPVGAQGGIGLLGNAGVQQSALFAWQAVDPGVAITYVDVPNDGRLVVAGRGLQIGGGLVRYHYVVHNLNSDRAVRGIHFSFPAGTIVGSARFHDVDYHSGEPFSGADWTPSTTPTTLSWVSQTYAANQNANALRWGTAYDFSFESTQPPSSTIGLDLFKPGTPSNATATLTPNVGCPPQPTIPPATLSYSSNTAAPYDFVDISTTGTPGPTGDDNSLTANLGFTFTLYGTQTTQIQISTNGFLALPGHNATSFSNISIPNSAEPNGIVCGYWDDLHPLTGTAGGGFIRYQTIGNAPNRRFVVHYVGVWHYGGTAASAETFEILLDEGTNAITLTCVATASVANGGTGLSATRGIESDTGQAGILIPAPVGAGTSVRFTPGGVSIPTSALLFVDGSGEANTTLSLRILGVPSKPIILGADLLPGPISLGPTLGQMNLGFSSAFFALADGLGAFLPPNPAHATDSCGNFLWSYSFGPQGLPSGLNLYLQGIVVDPTAPNSAFHLTTPRTLVVP